MTFNKMPSSVRSHAAPASHPEAIARLERELATLKETQQKQQGHQIQLVNDLPGRFGVKSVNEVIQILKSFVSPSRRAHKIIRQRAFISDSKRLQIVAAYNAHRRSVVDIAKKYGCSAQAVYAIARKAKEAMTVTPSGGVPA